MNTKNGSLAVKHSETFREFKQNSSLIEFMASTHKYSKKSSEALSNIQRFQATFKLSDNSWQALINFHRNQVKHSETFKPKLRNINRIEVKEQYICVQHRCGTH